MTPRDYKNTNARTARTARTGARPGSWISFVSGLGIGLVVAFGVYLWAAQLPPPATVVSDLNKHLRGEEAAFDPSIERAPELPRPTFDFYKILPEMEVPIPDWELTEKPAAEAAVDTGLAPGTYVLQVGSFKRFEDADRAKASLALRGIIATIQRVVINGQDVWFRVHVGPLSDISEIRAMRMQLIENDMDFILLRIGGNQAAAR